MANDSDPPSAFERKTSPGTAGAFHEALHALEKQHVRVDERLKRAAENLEDHEERLRAMQAELPAIREQLRAQDAILERIDKKLDGRRDSSAPRSNGKAITELGTARWHFWTVLLALAASLLGHFLRSETRSNELRVPAGIEGARGPK